MTDNSASAASADALTPTGIITSMSNSETTTLKRAVGDTHNRFSKKQRFTQPTSKRRGGAFYAKQKPLTSLQIVPRRRRFPIFTSNIGCRELAIICFQVIRGKDFRLSNSISELQLIYVLSISWLNRVIQCGIQYGYAFPSSASRLKQIASGIQLPSVLATFIESIGEFQLPSGATVVPYSGSYEELFPPNYELMISPAFILHEAGRIIPPGDWALDVDWIVAYNDATTRASRSGMNFRIVDNSIFQGRAEMVVSFKPIPQDNMLLPKVPHVMSEAEAQLGAVYRFRNYNEREQWLGSNKDLLFDAFTAIPFDPRVQFSDVCVAAFKGMHVSTD